MNLQELQTVQSKERQRDSLQNLRPTFYRDVGAYISELEDERQRVADAADDPFSSPEVGRLTDEIETAKDVVEAIYERRMGKLVKQASLAAAGMPADDEGLTAEESDLFDDLVDRIRQNKGRVLDVLDGVDATGTPHSSGEQRPQDTTPAVPPEESPSTRPNTKAASETPPSTGELDDTPGTATSQSPGESGGGDTPPIPPDDPPAGADATSETDAEMSVADVMGGEMETQPPSPPSQNGDSRSSPEAGTETVTPPTGPEHVSPAEQDGAAEPASGGDEDAGLPSGRDSESTNTEVDRVTIRVTQDVGSLLGVDNREYTLASDDIVQLPEQNAIPLVERDAAEPLE